MNQILVTLGFRTQIRADTPQAPQPPLRQDEAWISVLVSGKKGEIDSRVDVTEVTAQQPSDQNIPTTVGILRPRGIGARLKDLFFPSKARLPSSGGRTVSTDKIYRITVRDLRPSGKLYDAMGQEIATLENATMLRFGPRAIVDFVIVLPTSTLT